MESINMQALALTVINPIKKLIQKFGPKTLIYYGVVGGLSAALNFLVFALLWDAFHIHYKIAVTFSYFLSVLFNFVCNRFLTFKETEGRLVGHLTRYLTMIGINYLITIAVLHFFVEILFLSPYLGLFFAIGITALTGFTMSKYWVFPQTSE